jgi:hypothetical protein
MSRETEIFTRRQFLKKNIFLALAFAVLGFSREAFGRPLRRESNISDKEARFYSKLAG